MNNSKCKAVVSFILIQFLWVANANTLCSILIRGDAPLFSKIIGEKTFEIPLDGSHEIYLKIGETINAQCLNRIKLGNTQGYNQYDLHHPYDPNSLHVLSDFNELNELNEFNDLNDLYDSKEKKTLSKVMLKCTKNAGSAQINWYDFDEPMYSHSRTLDSDILIKCIEGERKLYESNETLPSCQNYTSFGIGTHLQGSNMDSIGICFDFDTLTTKYVKYYAHRSKYELLNENSIEYSQDSHTTPIISLDNPVESFDVMFKDISPSKYFKHYLLEKNKNPLLSVSEFELLNLVQDTKISTDVTDFRYLLNTVWWHNLHDGNWKLFLQAFQQRTDKVKYIVYTGTSGKVFMPSSGKCEDKENEIFKISVSESQFFRVPEIIWMYLKPQNSNKTDEFVVFGYNTPFYSTATETIKCDDICKEIDWLYNGYFRKTHLLPTFGVMHCCRPKDIASQLDTFPEEEILDKN